MEKLSEGKTEDEIKNLQEELSNGGYEEIPDSHIEAAKKKLAGKSEAYVSLTSGGKLSKLAALRRKEKKRRHIDSLGTKEYNRRRSERKRRSTNAD